MVAMSKTPNHATAACMQSDTFDEVTESATGTGAYPWPVDFGSSPAALQLTAASPARYPPADTPQVIARVGSIPYFEALIRSQRIAAFTSWACAGNFASLLKRYSTEA